MGTGRARAGGYDLSLTELIENGRPVYVVHAGTEEGARLLAELAPPAAAHAQVAAAERLVAEAGACQTRRLQTEGIKELLYQNYENPHWEEVARRCLTCTNCTMVCPTCFCSTIEEATDLTGGSPNGGGGGIRATRSIFPTSTAAACGTTPMSR